MTQLGEETSQRPRIAPDNPAEALAAVVENATALARAELRLAATEARAWLIRISLGLAMLWLAVLLLQIFVLLLALTPVLLHDQPVSNVVWMLALSLLPVLGALAFAARELRRLKAVSHAKHDDKQ